MSIAAAMDAASQGGAGGAEFLVAGAAEVTLIAVALANLDDPLGVAVGAVDGYGVGEVSQRSILADNRGSHRSMSRHIRVIPIANATKQP